ncbi:MAG: hypothetical protein AB1762_12445 [Gemmatimonadota bacterium]
MTLTLFVLGGLAVWRVSHLVVREDGPWRVFAALRRRAESTMWEELLGCIYCMSLWVAAPAAFALGEGWLERVVAWPALSGAALIVDRIVHRETVVPATVEFLEDVDDGMLRSGTGGSPVKHLDGVAAPRNGAPDDSPGAQWFDPGGIRG